MKYLNRYLLTNLFFYVAFLSISSYHQTIISMEKPKQEEEEEEEQIVYQTKKPADQPKSTILRRMRGIAGSAAQRMRNFGAGSAKILGSAGVGAGTSYLTSKFPIEGGGAYYLGKLGLSLDDSSRVGGFMYKLIDVPQWAVGRITKLIQDNPFLTILGITSAAGVYFLLKNYPNILSHRNSVLQKMRKDIEKAILKNKPILIKSNNLVSPLAQPFSSSKKIIFTAFIQKIENDDEDDDDEGTKYKITIGEEKPKSTSDGTLSNPTAIGAFTLSIEKDKNGQDVVTTVKFSPHAPGKSGKYSTYIKGTPLDFHSGDILSQENQTSKGMRKSIFDSVKSRVRNILPAIKKPEFKDDPDDKTSLSSFRKN